MSIKLVGSFGSWSLPEGVTLLGRSKDCGICIMDSRLSRLHARFIVLGERIEIEDPGSTNGIVVNGKRLSSRRHLLNGDRLIIGPCDMVVVIDRTVRIEQRLVTLAPSTQPVRNVDGNHTEPMQALTESDLVQDDTLMDAAIAAAVKKSPQKTMSPGGFGSANSGLQPVVFDKSQHEAPLELRRPDAEQQQPALRSNLRLTESGDLLTHSAAFERSPPPGVEQGERSGSRMPSSMAPSHQTTALGPSLALRRLRLGAAACDGASILVRIAILALPILICGYGIALVQAGAAMQHGLPVLGAGDRAGAVDLALSLFAPGGLARAGEMLGTLRHSGQRPFLIVFLALTCGMLVAVQAYLFATVVATMRHGAPYWHSRFGLAVVDARTGDPPTWMATMIRWLALLALWPIALGFAVASRRGPHDRIAGTELRRRASLASTPPSAL
ncbi:MAG: FHA domain-containing protein [Planctomycetes bacterium]|nr:FHA domain-containing protein [Planctomycetota bacterium]